MRDPNQAAAPFDHSHSFLGRGHGANERRTWAVIWLCGAMMVGEIVGGLLFGSIALVADGLHMSTHAGALLLAALAYTYARKLDDDQRFTFGTGKLGDLAGFTSAIILAMIALLIAYESVSRLFSPVPIHFAEAIPIACLGLVVNLASAWLLSGGHHHHGHTHAHDHGAQGDHDEAQRLTLGDHAVRLEIFEEGVPPVFRLRAESGASLVADACAIETLRPDGTRQSFAMADRGRYLESIEDVGEPHQFEARVRIGADEGSVGFEEPEHAHAKAGRDNNLRAAVVHVVADAAVSMFVIGRPAAGQGVRMDLDGPAGRHRRRLCHRQLVVWPDPRHRGHPARHEPRSTHGRQPQTDDRMRRRQTGRSASVAAGPRPSRRHRLRPHPAGARVGLLQSQAGAFQRPVAPHDRDSAFLEAALAQVSWSGCWRETMEA